MVRRFEEDPILAGVTQALVERLDPERIILFGSRARGDIHADSDYDLAVEVDAEKSAELRSKASRVASEAARGVGIDVHLRQPGEIESRRDDPGYIDWDIARDGIVVYAAPGAPRRVWERPKAESSVPMWLQKAHTDLVTIDACREYSITPWEAVCFHAQQAAEKYLKAALVTLGVRPERTHDLAELVAQLRANGIRLPDLAAESELLTPFGVEVRYPDDVPSVTREVGESAVVAMRTIVAAVTPLVRHHLR